MSRTRLALRLAGLLAGVLLALVVAALALLLSAQGGPLVLQVAQSLSKGALRAEGVEGGLLGPLKIEKLVWENHRARVEVQTLQLRWQPQALLANTLSVSRIEAASVIVRLKPAPETPPAPLTTRLPLALRLGEVRVAEVQVFTASANAAPMLQLSHLQMAADWIDERIRLHRLGLIHPQFGALGAAGVLQLHGESLELKPLALHGPGAAQITGQLGLHAQPSQLRLLGQELRWPLTGAAQIRLPQLELLASGRPDDYQARLRGRAVSALPATAARGTLGFALQVELAGNAEMLRLRQLEVQGDGDAGRLSATAQLHWHPALSVVADAQLVALNPGLLLPDWPGVLSGRVQARTERKGEGIQVRAEAALARSTLRGRRFDLDSQALFLRAPGLPDTLSLNSFDLRLGSVRLQAQGAALPLLDLRGNFTAAKLADLAPGLAGRAQASFSAQGAPDNPALQAKGFASELAWVALSPRLALIGTDKGQSRLGQTPSPAKAGERRPARNSASAPLSPTAGGREAGREGKALHVKTANFAINYSPGKNSEAQLVAQGIEYGAHRIDHLLLDASGRWQNHQLRLAVSAPQGDAQFALAGNANLQTRQWRGRLETARIASQGAPVLTLAAAAPLEVSAKHLSLHAACWQGEGALACLDADWAAPRLKLGLDLRQFALATLKPLLPEGWQLGGTLAGRGMMELDGATPIQLSADFTLPEGQLAAPGAPLLRFAPSTLQVRQLAAEWRAEAVLVSNHGRLDASAGLPVQGGAIAERPLHGQLKIDLPSLAFLQGLVPRLSELDGRVAGSLSLAGTPAAPKLSGSVQLSEGQLKVPATGLRFTAISASLRGDDSGVLQLEGSARGGEGVLKITGSAAWRAGKPALEIQLDGDNVQVADSADARLWISPALRFSYTEGLAKLRGSVTVPRADITPRRLDGGAVAASRDQIIVGEKSDSARGPVIDAEVQLLLGDAVRFKGFGLTARLTGALALHDAPGLAGTRASGEIRVPEGRYKAYGQQLKITGGRLLWAGDPIARPTLDLRAERKPRDDVTIAVHVRGTLDAPAFEVSSTPAMPREEQIGWLVLGRPLATASGGERAQVSGAAMSLGFGGGEFLAEALGQKLGLKLDELSLGAQPGDSADSARLTIGKYLSPRLYVSYGVGLLQPGYVFKLLYDLGHGFKLRTETGVQTGGDLLYSVDR